MSGIVYIRDRRLDPGAFVDLLGRSTLAERRPVNDPSRIRAMLDAYTLHVTAWDGGRLVGVSTAWTDHAFTCYLADLAVDATYQHRGIGRRLVEETRGAAGPLTTLILLSAPKAMGFYSKVGLERAENCYVIRREG